MGGTGPIKWSQIERPEFDRVVEALLQRIHGAEPGVTVEAFDGRGGDQGCDVVVSREGVVWRIYQLKYFPEGFSGGNVKRRQQIKKSFTRAMEHAPVEWVLVIPGNPTTTEKHFVNSLKGKADVAVSVMGRAALDSELAARPDLLDAFTRDPLIATLTGAGMEARGLVKPVHLSDTLDDLRRRVASRSPYWDMALEISPEGTVQRLYAKHPNAAELEPIGLHFTTAVDRLPPETRARLDALFDYGTDGGSNIVIPSEAVISFAVTGPEWIAHEHQGGQVEILSLPPATTTPMEVRVVREDGTTITAIRGHTAGPASGAKGTSLRATFTGGLTLEFRFPKGSAAGGEITLSHELVGEDAIAVNRVLKFEAVLDAPQIVELWANGALVTKLRSGGGLHTPGEVDATALLAEDLAVIAAEFDVPLVIPSDVTAVDRVEIRSLRLLLEGHCVLVPDISGFHLTLDGSTDSTLEGFLRQPAVMMRVTNGLEYTVQGHQLRPPDTDLFHPALGLVEPDASTVLEALAAGTAKGLRVHFLSTDKTPLRAFMPARVTNPDYRLVPVTLGVPGLREHPAIALIAEARAGLPEPPAIGILSPDVTA